MLGVDGGQPRHRGLVLARGEVPVVAVELEALEDPGLLRQGELAGVAAIPVGVERRR